jgi:hypothetical protein
VDLIKVTRVEWRHDLQYDNIRQWSRASFHEVEGEGARRDVTHPK